ncbi:MAG: PH domain-containing protein [Actinocatenispora sp.]
MSDDASQGPATGTRHDDRDDDPATCTAGGAPPATSTVDGDRADLAGLRLRPPRHRVSPRAKLHWLVRAGISWLVLVAAQVVALVVGWHPVSEWAAVTLPVTVVLAAAHLTIMPQWRYRVHRWESTGQAVYTQAGWFNQERRIAPVSRIQTVDSERGPLEQLFGLTNVTVTTASAAGPLKIEGLDRDTAQELVDQLTTYTDAQHGDAT